MKKICKIMLITFMIINVFSIIYDVQATDIWEQGKNFLDIGQSQANKGGFNTTEVTDEFIRIIDFLYGIGLMIVFVATIILGIKYMMVNPNEKSRIKQATTPYIIGVVIIFGAATIWRLVIALLEGSMLGR